MNKSSLILILLFFSLNSIANDHQRLFGHWKGVKMFQDEKSYDGKTFFLPNEGEMVLTPEKVKLYYYPYFKSAEFEVQYSEESITYFIGDKEIMCEYRFLSDTLEFEMHYINKTFVKLFVPKTMDQTILKELDEFGFTTDQLVHEFELDTLHSDLRKGFTDYDSLGFDPIQFIEFPQSDQLMLNRKDKISFSKGYKEIQFNYNGVSTRYKVQHVSSTQRIFLKPITDCECDSITIPYLTVSWADRIRQAIIDEENF